MSVTNSNLLWQLQIQIFYAANNCPILTEFLKYIFSLSYLSSRDRVRATAHSDSGKLQFSTTEIYDFTAGNTISLN